jgi:mannose-6-phosphate isomerase-like protein (cupin superfamily)
MRVVNVEHFLTRIADHWKPHVVGQVNDSSIKLAKLHGEFVWHQHDEEDEMFFVMHGTLRMKIRDGSGEREEAIRPGEFIIIPRKTQHLPIADEEVHIMLVEPLETVNTGEAEDARRITDLPRL